MEQVRRYVSSLPDNNFPPSVVNELRDSLRVCAMFRGTYLDYKARAEAFFNQHFDLDLSEGDQPVQFTLSDSMLPSQASERLTSPSMALRNRQADDEDIPRRAFRKGELIHKSVMGDEHVTVKPTTTASFSAWPDRTDSTFRRFNSMMERCNDVLDLALAVI